MRADGVSGVLRQLQRLLLTRAPDRPRRRRDRRATCLHHADALRQAARGRGLDDQPREQYGALEGPTGHFQTRHRRRRPARGS